MVIRPKLREKVENLPNKPGVYLMRDRLGRVIYVGKALSLRKRVTSYFQPARRSSAEPKLLALVDSIYDFEIHVVKNEPEAILLEGKLIKEYKPKYNVSFRDDKRFLMVKLTRDSFPRFALARIRKDDGCRYFGPFTNSGSVRRSLEFILRKFGIRACHAANPGEKEYKHCHNDIIKLCSAPCVGRISREEYAARIEQACLLLEGKNGEVLRELEEEMHREAGRKRFEAAAQLRDAIHDLRNTARTNQRKFIRDLPKSNDPLAEMQELRDVLGLERLPEVIEGFDISHISGTHAVGSMVRFVRAEPDKSAYRHFRIKSVETIDDYASMLEIVGRRYRRLKDEGKKLPDVILVDGGRGQLGVAMAALEGLGVRIPVFGLAKEQEQIHLAGRPAPIDLPDTSPALHLIQRIRDEAHRFANAYHRNWRKKKIRESILDDVEGIGENRKKLLLQSFGSVERLRKATLEELASVPGVGAKMAAELKRVLSVEEIDEGV